MKIRGNWKKKVLLYLTAYIFRPSSSPAVINSSNNNNFYSNMPAKKNGKQSYTAESLDIDWHIQHDLALRPRVGLSRKSLLRPPPLLKVKR
jgi:hypothetical protein